MNFIDLSMSSTARSHSLNLRSRDLYPYSWPGVCQFYLTARCVSGAVPRDLSSESFLATKSYFAAKLCSQNTDF